MPLTTALDETCGKINALFLTNILMAMFVLKPDKYDQIVTWAQEDGTRKGLLVILEGVNPSSEQTINVTHTVTAEEVISILAKKQDIISLDEAKIRAEKFLAEIKQWPAYGDKERISDNWYLSYKGKENRHTAILHSTEDQALFVVILNEEKKEY